MDERVSPVIRDVPPIEKALSSPQPEASGALSPAQPSPPKFIRGDDGILYRLEPLTDSPFYPAKRLHDISTGIESTEVRFKSGSGKEMSSRLNNGLLSNPNELLALNNIGALLNRKEAQSLSETMVKAALLCEREIFASATGWHDDKFIVPGGAVEMPDFDVPSWRGQGDSEKVRRVLREVFSWGVTPLLIAISASAVSPLIERLNVNRMPIVALSCASNSGKTTTTNFALSLWCRPNGDTLDFENTTVNALLKAIQQFSGLPIALQDVQNFHLDDVKQLPYILASGRERQRLNHDFNLGANTRWQGTALLTGEYSILRREMKVGAVNRLLELDEYPLGSIGSEGQKRKTMLDEVSQAHAGVLRQELATLIEDIESNTSVNAKRTAICKMQECSQDAAELAALLATGTTIVARLAHLNDETLAQEVITYILDATSRTREAGSSPAKTVLADIKNVLETEYGGDALIKNAQGIIAKRVQEGRMQDGTSRTVWYINQAHPLIARCFPMDVTFQAVRQEWAAEGLLKVTYGKGNAPQYNHTVAIDAKRPSWPGLYLTVGASRSE